LGPGTCCVGLPPGLFGAGGPGGGAGGPAPGVPEGPGFFFSHPLTPESTPQSTAQRIKAPITRFMF